MTSVTATATATATPSVNGLLARIGAFFAMLGAVHRVKVAVEAQRQPVAADLRRLGIDPEQMPSLRGARI